MAIYNKSGMMQVVCSRWTRLDQKGRPKPGPKNRFFSDSMMSISYTAFYNKQDDVTGLNGAGIACITYSPPKTLLRLDISDLQFCYPDPQAVEFLAGGVVFEDVDETPIGYAAPKVGMDPKPEGVAMEVWASQVANGGVVGYFHFCMPRAKLTLDKDQELNGDNFWQMGLQGICNENPFYESGVADELADWPVTERIYQWIQEDELPGDSYGYAEVPEPVVTP